MLNPRPITLTTGLVLSKLALFMYLPTGLALIDGGRGLVEFLSSALITQISGLVLLRMGQTARFRLSVRDMFLLTTWIWLIASAYAALPLMLIQHTSFTDAYFETMSGITTTGSTVLSGLDTLPHSVLLWRSILQWLGGIGFIVMGVAILPFLNVGGMRLFQTESSDWSEKSHPRAKTVAKYIVLVYLAITFGCVIGYLAAGMTPFEAINHAMTTVSTGGYSTSDASMAHFSPAAHWVGILFMYLGSLPFLLFVQTLRARHPGTLLHDAQVRGFTLLLLSSGLLMASWLSWHNHLNFLDAVRLSLFNIVSVVTTTGYALTDYSQWGSLTTVIFALLTFVGGCSGSTAGGIKIFRFQVAASMLRKQVLQQLHPSGVFVQKYNGRPVNDAIIRSLVAFLLAFFITIGVIAIFVSLCGVDPVTSLTGSLTAVTNVGPGLGEVIGPAGNFASLPEAAKWALSLGMLMGRLEILTVAVLFFPAFWRN